jgi:hypothetical protein
MDDTTAPCTPTFPDTRHELQISPLGTASLAHALHSIVLRLNRPFNDGVLQNDTVQHMHSLEATVQAIHATFATLESGPC